MFEPRTLFIVGAGASSEASLPTGNQLKASIAKKIDIKFERGIDQITGDHQITEALRQHVRITDGDRGDINPYLEAGWQIRDAMPQAISIDNFLDSHQGNERIELCGKLAIVQSILEAEKRSLLFYDEQQPDAKINYNDLQNTWYNSFMQLLTEGFHKGNINLSLDNVSFVIFNYDRCIEHFLYHALQNYFVIEPAEAGELMQGLKIFHPYGVVGLLPWQTDHDAIPFGSSHHGRKLLSLAGQIKTFTERIEDETGIAALRQLLQDAENVVFIGFAFHRQNMELMKPNFPCNTKRVFATAKGISRSDCDIVQRQILDLVSDKMVIPEIKIENQFTCHSLFREFWRSLSVS